MRSQARAPPPNISLDPAASTRSPSKRASLKAPLAVVAAVAAALPSQAEQPINSNCAGLVQRTCGAGRRASSARGLVTQATANPQDTFKRSWSCSNLAALQDWQRGKEGIGKAAGIHAKGSREIHAINRRTVSLISQVVPRLLRLHPLNAIFTGILLYATVVLTFAPLFYAMGESCFDSEEEITDHHFLQMVPRQI